MRLLVTLCLIVCAAGCRSKSPDGAALKTEQDALDKDATDLIVQRGSMQRERKKIADQRSELVERRKQLSRDANGQAALDEQERKISAEEGQLDQRESQLNDKLDQLLKQRGDLVVRATQAAGGAGADPLERAAHREQSVASREKELADREHTLASREKELADRERALAKREKETCSVASAPPTEAPRGLKYSARDVEPTYRRALKIMQERGLLSADLPPGATRLVDETRENMKRGDYARAKYDAEQLLATIEEVKIDRNFIASKMARLAQAMHGKKLASSENDLFQEATANYGDGKFAQANGKINRLFSMLR